MKVIGTDTEWALRAPSALLGIGNIVAIYWLGVLIGGRIAGVLAAAGLATSGFHIWYSQEARMYTLLALAATLYAAAAFFFVKSPTYARAALLAVCGLALVYSHPFGVLNWIAIAIGISANILLASTFPRRALFQWVIANVAIAVGFLLWAPVLLQGARQYLGNFWAPYPSLDFIYKELNFLVGGRLGAASLLIGAAIALRSNLRASLVLVFWAVAPVGLALIESFVSTPLFIARYFIGALPALVTLSALGVTHLLTRLKWPTTVAAIIILAAMIFGNRYVKEHSYDWRAVAAYLQERLQNSDCVLVYPSYTIPPLRYYLRREFCPILPDSIAKIDGQAIGVVRVFAVLSHLQASEINRFRATMSDYGREADHFDALGIDVIEYQR